MGGTLGQHSVIVVGRRNAQRGRPGLPLTPCISLPRGSSWSASPCSPALLGVAPCQPKHPRQGACGVFVQVTSVPAQSMQKGSEENHDDASNSNVACLFLVVILKLGTAEGGNGRTPSAASISLPSSVASSLHLGSGTCVYASGTCSDSVIPGSLIPASGSRSAFFSSD